LLLTDFCSALKLTSLTTIIVTHLGVPSVFGRQWHWMIPAGGGGGTRWKLRCLLWLIRQCPL